MKVVVDRDKCRDHGQCALAAPAVFEMDGEGILVVLQEHPDESLRADVEAAVDVCPELAITIED